MEALFRAEVNHDANNVFVDIDHEFRITRVQECWKDGNDHRGPGIRIQTYREPGTESNAMHWGPEIPDEMLPQILAAAVYLLQSKGEVSRDD